jgi:hypothetical protein
MSLLYNCNLEQKSLITWLVEKDKLISSYLLVPACTPFKLRCGKGFIQTHDTFIYCHVRRHLPEVRTDEAGERQGGGGNHYSSLSLNKIVKLVSI